MQYLEDFIADKIPAMKLIEKSVLYTSVVFSTDDKSEMIKFGTNGIRSCFVKFFKDSKEVNNFKLNIPKSDDEARECASEIIYKYFIEKNKLNTNAIIMKRNAKIARQLVAMAKELVQK